jgi:hypothetical protein
MQICVSSLRDTTFLKRGSRLYLNQDDVDAMETLTVTKVPPTPVGPARYAVEYNDKDPLASVTDHWNWNRAQPCKRKGFCKEGRRTLQTCRGSLECSNQQCPYRKIYQRSNQVDFSIKKKCTHCKETPTTISCSARKYVENDRCHKRMTVIYIGEHDCTPRQIEKKPDKHDVENILRTRPTITTSQLQIDTVREALLSGKDAQEVQDVAMTYSNTRHLLHLRTCVNNKTKPGGSDVAAVNLLQQDFQKRNLDENLILKVGEDFVILSSAQKIRLGALITLGYVDEPVSLDGCESHSKDFTELELTTYYPVLRRNVKLVSMFAPKPGENSENVEIMVNTFDEAVNKILPSVAREYGIDPTPFAGKGLDPQSYVGDEGGALWCGLAKAKGVSVKSKTISDVFHIKQDIRRHLKYFKVKKDQENFQTLMSAACNAPTSIQADEAEKALERLIEKKSSNPAKMKNFKTWWWRRRCRWQQWCKTESSTSASSAEVANAKSLSASGFRKRLLDVVTTECSAAILEAAEIRRQSEGLKTVGRGPSSADRAQNRATKLLSSEDACATAVQNIAENADLMTARSVSLTDIESAHMDYRVNTRDSHRSDKTKRLSGQVKKRSSHSVTKHQLRYFEKNVENVHMDLLKCDSSMTEFKFKLLDTMGYLEDIILSKDTTSCSSSWCSSKCHHLLWILHRVFNFDKNNPVIYKQKFSKSDWSNIITAFPENLPLANIPEINHQGYIVNVRNSSIDAKCAVCKKELVNGDVQVVTEGPYRTIHRKWIKRTFFFCPTIKCITKVPRNSFIQPYCPSNMEIQYDDRLTLEQRNLINIFSKG